MLCNLFWESILTASSKPKKFLIIGNEPHHHQIYRDLNNMQDVLVRLVNPHSWDLGTELSENQEDLSILASGLNTRTFVKTNENDHLAIREIWPEATYSPWKMGLETLERSEFLKQFQDQILVAEKDGHARIKRAFFSMQKLLSKLELEDHSQQNAKKQKSLMNFQKGWGYGLCRVTHMEGSSNRMTVHHLRYTSKTIDFFLAKNLTEWISNSKECTETRQNNPSVKLVISTPQPIFSGFLQKYLGQNLRIPIQNIVLPDILFGDNFSTAYLNFFSLKDAAIYVDMGHFPDIYVWVKKGVAS